METKKEQLITEVVYQDNRTYEIKKKINGYKGYKAILIGLYPTVDGGNITKIDSTQFHLINHMKELGLNEVRIMNLYPKVFTRKPSTSQLSYDKDNFEYIIKAINEDDAGDYKLIIAYGSSHSSNKMTNTIKRKLLEEVGNSKIKDNVYQISSEYNDTIVSAPTHVLYLGLRHGDEKWNLIPLDIKIEKEKISSRLVEEEQDKAENKKRMRKKQNNL